MRTPFLLALLALPASSQHLLVHEIDRGRILRLDAFDGSPIDLAGVRVASDGAPVRRAPFALRPSRGTLLVGRAGAFPVLCEYDAGGALLESWALDGEPRGVCELGDGRLLWTSSRGVHALDPATGEACDLLTGVSCSSVGLGGAQGGAPPLARAGGAALKPPYVHDQLRVNVGGLNANGDDRIDGISIDEDPTAPGTFLMAWAEQLGTSELTQDIYCARSLDNGASWSTPLRVDLGDAANLHDSEFPKLRFAADGSAVVVWEENRDAAPLGSQGDDLYYNRSTDGGLTWMPEARALNTATAGSHVGSDVRHIGLDAQGERFHVVWEEASTPGHDRVWWTQSTDAGATWSPPLALTSGAGDVDGPQVLVDGQRLHVLYIDDVDGDDNVHYLRSTDGGLSWSIPISIESDTDSDADAARLALDGDTLCATWLEEAPSPGGDRVRGAVSTDGGLTWGAEIALSPQVSGVSGADADWPNAVVRGDGIFVAFNQDAAGFNQCFVSHSLDGGLTWTYETPLEPGVIAHRPVIVALEGLLAVRCEHGPNGANVTAFVYSLDDGATWIPAGEVPNAGPDVDEGNLLEQGSFVATSEVTRSLVVGHFDRPTGSNEVYASVFEAPAAASPGGGP